MKCTKNGAEVVPTELGRLNMGSEDSCHPLGRIIQGRTFARCAPLKSFEHK